MEATSLYLVFFELILAVIGATHFIYTIVSNRKLPPVSVIYILVLTIISIAWAFHGAPGSRWMGIKIGVFVSCLYLASVYPRYCMYLLVCLLSVGFVLDNIVSGAFDPKHVGSNANQLLPIPFLAIGFGLILYNKKKHVNVWLLYSAIAIEVIFATIFGVRGSIVGAAIILVILHSRRASTYFIKYAQWIPFGYLLFVVFSFYSIITKLSLVPVTPSNIERSSMISSAIFYFPDYVLTGPRGEFDRLAGPASSLAGLELYVNDKGVDPHCFILSFWRDEGAVLTLLWLLPWFFYWKSVKRLFIYIEGAHSRVVLGMLTIAVVQFSLSPPSTGMRLLVALTMGAALEFGRRLQGINQPVRAATRA